MIPRRIGIVLALLVLTASGCLQSRSDKPDIFLIVIDALRADHLGCYGYGRDTSPVLDSLAASGTLFTRTQSQAPWTAPSMATLWTGCSPRAHGVGRREGVLYGLSPQLENIATLLGAHEYVTLGFLNAYPVSGFMGFGHGFDHYSCAMAGHGRAAETLAEVTEWLHKNRGNPAPRLTVIHLFDVHAPYDPPGGYDTLFSVQGSMGLTEWRTDSLTGELLTGDLEHMLAMYDGEIAWTDAQLGRFFAYLRSSGAADRSYIIITADHGEEFLDHGGISHGHALHQELLHVPLIVTGPGIPAGVRDSTPCGLIDILPTLAGFAGAPVPETAEGIDLFGTTPLPRERTLPSSGVIRGHFLPGPDAIHESACAVLRWPLKGTVNFVTGEETLFDLESDPGELSPREMDSTLLEEIEYYWAQPMRVTPPAVVDDNVDDNLRDLGYIR